MTIIFEFALALMLLAHVVSSLHWEKKKIINRKITSSKIISSKIKMLPLTGVLSRQFDLI